MPNSRLIYILLLRRLCDTLCSKIKEKMFDGAGTARIHDSFSNNFQTTFLKRVTAVRQLMISM